MSHFRPIKRDINYLFPPSMNDWLPEQHLARFVVEIVEQLDLKGMERAYRETGSGPVTPRIAPVYPGLRLCYGRVLQPKAGERHPRLGCISVCGGGRAP